MRINKRKARAGKSGFSLLELLLVMALVPVVFFAVYTNFSTGFRVWAHVTRQVPEEDLQIFYQKVDRDLRNMRRFSVIPFEGDEEELGFAAAIEAAPELGGSRGIGLIRIFYDAGKHAIVREVRDYSQVHEEKEGERSVLLGGVGSFGLSYFSKGTLDSRYGWNDSWKPDPEKLPTAVKLSFTVDSAAEKQEHTVFIPVGGTLPVGGALQ